MGSASEERIAAVRRFSRFYTKRLGVLEESLLRSPFTLPEARLVYELAHHDRVPATELAGLLGLDPGYVSRLVSGLEEQGVVAKEASPDDGRVRLASLTEQGRAAFGDLDRASHDQVGAMLERLPADAQERLVEALAAVEEILGHDARVPYLLRPPEPGDLGWMVERQSWFYHRAHGWDHRFEALAADVVATFLANFDPARERCWIAERGGARVGSVFVCARSGTEAQLRMLYVEPSARGLGIGRRLVEECTRFARSRGYERIMLWTNRGLDSARRLYEAEGYVLAREEVHDRFGGDLMGQYWELHL